MNKQYQCALKGIALLTLFCFLANTLAWAAPLPGLNLAPSHEIFQPSLADAIEIPQELGTVQARFSPANAASTVIHIQDAHSSVQAQASIRKILHYLNEANDVDLVFLEGALGSLSPEQMNFFKDSKLNDQAAEKFEQAALIGGTERFLLDRHFSGQPASGYGVEDAKLYGENLQQFKTVFSQQETVLRGLRQLRTKIITQTSRIFNPELRDFFREWVLSQDRPEEMMRHFKTLEPKAEKILGLDFRQPESQIDWPQFVRLTRLEDLAGKIDTAKGTAEKKQLEEWIQTQGTWSEKQEIKDFMRLLKSAFSTSEKIKNPRLVAEKFYHEASSKDFSFKNYPELSKSLGQMILENEIQTEDLLSEMEQLTENIFKALLKNQPEKDLLSIYRNYLQFKKLSGLELTRQEALEILSRPQVYQPSVLFKGIESPEETSFDEFYAQALSFYETAFQREPVIFKRMSDQMKDHKKRVAVLITGGFHSQGLRENLEEKKIAYVEIMPRISDLKETNQYQEVMQSLSPLAASNHPSYLDLLVLKSQLPFAAKFFEIKGQEIVSEVRGSLTLAPSQSPSSQPRSEMRIPGVKGVIKNEEEMSPILIDQAFAEKFSKRIRHLTALGRPLSGKGTITRKLMEQINQFLPSDQQYVQFVVGDLFRAVKAIVNNEATSEQTRNYQWIVDQKLVPVRALQIMKDGGLISDDIVIEVLNEILKTSRYSQAYGIFFDGFPRTPGQLRALQNGKIILRGKPLKMDLSFILDVDEKVIRMRTQQRAFEALSQAETPRDDDNPKTVEKRLREYSEKTKAVVEANRGQSKAFDLEGYIPGVSVDESKRQVWSVFLNRLNQFLDSRPEISSSKSKLRLQVEKKIEGQGTPIELSFLIVYQTENSFALPNDLENTANLYAGRLEEQMRRVGFTPPVHLKLTITAGEESHRVLKNETHDFIFISEGFFSRLNPDLQTQLTGLGSAVIKTKYQSTPQYKHFDKIVKTLQLRSGARIPFNFSGSGKSSIPENLLEIQEIMKRNPWKFFEVGSKGQEISQQIHQAFQDLNERIHSTYENYQKDIALQALLPELAEGVSQWTQTLRALVDLEKGLFKEYQPAQNTKFPEGRKYLLWIDSSYRAVALVRWKENLKPKAEARFLLAVDNNPLETSLHSIKGNFRIDLNLHKKSTKAEFDPPDILRPLLRGKHRSIHLSALDDPLIFEDFIRRLNSKLAGGFSKENRSEVREEWTAEQENKISVLQKKERLFFWMEIPFLAAIFGGIPLGMGLGMTGVLNFEDFSDLMQLVFGPGFFLTFLPIMIRRNHYETLYQKEKTRLEEAYKIQDILNSHESPRSEVRETPSEIDLKTSIDLTGQEGRLMSLSHFSYFFIGKLYQRLEAEKKPNTKDIFQSLKSEEFFKNERNYGEWEDWDARIALLSYLISGKELSREALIKRLNQKKESDLYFLKNAEDAIGAIIDLSQRPRMKFTGNELLKEWYEDRHSKRKRIPNHRTGEIFDFSRKAASNDFDLNYDLLHRMLTIVSKQQNKETFFRSETRKKANGIRTGYVDPEEIKESIRAYPPIKQDAILALNEKNRALLGEIQIVLVDSGYFLAVEDGANYQTTFVDFKTKSIFIPAGLWDSLQFYPEALSALLARSAYYLTSTQPYEEDAASLEKKHDPAGKLRQILQEQFYNYLQHQDRIIANQKLSEFVISAPFILMNIIIRAGFYTLLSFVNIGWFLYANIKHFVFKKPLMYYWLATVDDYSPILKQLLGDNPAQRAQHLSAAIRDRDQSQIPIFLMALQDSHAQVRQVAAKGIGVFKVPEALESLSRILTNDTHQIVKEAAQEAVQAINESSPARSENRSEKKKENLRLEGHLKKFVEIFRDWRFWIFGSIFSMGWATKAFFTYVLENPTESTQIPIFLSHEITHIPAIYAGFLFGSHELQLNQHILAGDSPAKHLFWWASLFASVSVLTISYFLIKKKFEKYSFRGMAQWAFGGAVLGNTLEHVFREAVTNWWKVTLFDLSMVMNFEDLVLLATVPVLIYSILSAIFNSGSSVLKKHTSRATVPLPSLKGPVSESSIVSEFVKRSETRKNGERPKRDNVGKRPVEQPEILQSSSPLFEGEVEVLKTGIEMFLGNLAPLGKDLALKARYEQALAPHRIFGEAQKFTFDHSFIFLRVLALNENKDNFPEGENFRARRDRLRDALRKSIPSREGRSVLNRLLKYSGKHPEVVKFKKTLSKEQPLSNNQDLMNALRKHSKKMNAFPENYVTVLGEIGFPMDEVFSDLWIKYFESQTFYYKHKKTDSTIYPDPNIRSETRVSRANYLNAHQITEADLRTIYEIAGQTLPWVLSSEAVKETLAGFGQMPGKLQGVGDREQGLAKVETMREVFFEALTKAGFGELVKTIKLQEQPIHLVVPVEAGTEMRTLGALAMLSRVKQLDILVLGAAENEEETLQKEVNAGIAAWEVQPNQFKVQVHAVATQKEMGRRTQKLLSQDRQLVQGIVSDRTQDLEAVLAMRDVQRLHSEKLTKQYDLLTLLAAAYLRDAGKTTSPLGEYLNLDEWLRGKGIQAGDLNQELLVALHAAVQITIAA